MTQLDNMRDEDQAECLALGVDPLRALELSRERSYAFESVYRKGKKVAEWGYRVDSFLTSSASVWMLSFEPAGEAKVFFARRSRELLEDLLERFETLHCEVHAKYLKAVRWLEWLGFKIELVRSVGDEQFYLMKRDRNGNA